MGKFRISRVRNFSYPCKSCGKLHDSACMADICYQLDMKILEHEKHHLVPLKGNEHLVKENGYTNNK